MILIGVSRRSLTLIHYNDQTRTAEDGLLLVEEPEEASAETLFPSIWAGLVSFFSGEPFLWMWTVANFT